jgi:hypothetical protein
MTAQKCSKFARIVKRQSLRLTRIIAQLVDMNTESGSRTNSCYASPRSYWRLPASRGLEMLASNIPEELAAAVQVKVQALR